MIPTKKQLENIVEEADSVEQLEKYFEEAVKSGYLQALNDMEKVMKKLRSQNKEKAKPSSLNDDYIPGF